MFCHNVFSAVPLETAVGLEAVQQPLRERYSGDDGDVPGIDAWCTVFSSGIQMQVKHKRIFKFRIKLPEGAGGLIFKF